MGVKYLDAYGNSKLIVSQVKGAHEVKNEDLFLYHWATIAWEKKFKGFYVDHMPQKDNRHADALAYLTATLALSPKIE